MNGELDSLAAQFAARHDLQPPSRDEEGRYHFLIDGDLEIALFQHGHKIVLEAQLQPLPGGRNEVGPFLEQSLRRHLGRLRDHQEVLSLDPDDDRLVLFRQLSAPGLSVVDLDQAIGDFANGLAFWQHVSRAPDRPARLPMQQIFRP